MIAAGLVAARAHDESRSPRPVPSSAGPVPGYYAALTHPPDTATPNQLIVGNAVTGQALARLAPPAGTTFAGLTGAVDDRTFAVETQPFPQPLPAGRPAIPDTAGDGYTASDAAIVLPRTWYLLRVDPSAAVPARLARIPVPSTPAGQEVTALALSPDGSKLALAIQTHQPKGYKGVYLAPQLLRVYSVATGAVLRTWSTTQGSIDSGDFTPDNGTTMSWRPDGNHLAVFVNSDSPALRVLDVRSAGGDLATAGTQLTTGYSASCTRSPWAGYAPVLLAPDGTTLVCAWYDDTAAPGLERAPHSCAAITLLAGIADYPLSAPAAASRPGTAWQPWRPSRTMITYSVKADCGASTRPQLAWSSPDGGQVIAYLPSPGPGWGLYRPGGYTRLRVASVPDPHYVAW